MPREHKHVRNVTAEQFGAYLRVFHDTLAETAAQSLAPQVASRLRHLAYLPGRIMGYISTQHGVAFEYKRAAATTFEVILGSARVEELLVGVRPASSDYPTMIQVTDCHDFCIGKLTLEGAFPFRIDGDSYLTLEEVGFEFGEFSRSVEYAEVYTERGADMWSEARAVERAKEEVIAALVDLASARRRDEPLDSYVAGFKQKTVLALGDYSKEGRRRLASIKAGLESLGYNPLLVEDVPDDPHLDLSQKVVMLGTMARFVVMDDSSPSGHLAEFPLCRDNRLITVILRANGIRNSAMTAGASLQSTVIREAVYDPERPLEALRASVEWAERRLGELKRDFALCYPWRAASTPEDA